MPSYEFRCQKCRQVFAEEHSMTETFTPKCTSCGSEDCSRIWGATIRTGGVTPDVGQGTTKQSSGSGGGGCGSCSSHSCGTCH